MCRKIRVLAGGDVLATAKTGSGKTAAFVLPLLQRWLASPRTTPKRVHTLILVPTRELAAQVREVGQQCSHHLPERLKMVSAIGGASINPQMMALRGGADLIVATPARSTRRTSCNEPSGWIPPNALPCCVI